MNRVAWAVVLAVCIWARFVAASIRICGQDCSWPDARNTFCANAWDQDGSGHQCLSISDDLESFDATWKWMSSPVSVHSFPHVKLGSPSLPIKLEEISSLVLSAQWGMGPGPNTASGLDSGGLSNLQVVANVAYDIWADLDPAKAANDSVAGIEIMIWLGIFGTAQPLGFSKKSSCWRQKLGDAHFTLYIGQGNRGQTVLTWVSDTNQTQISRDISPLIQYLWRNNLVPATAYIATVEFGSEAFYSKDTVTFSAKSFSLNVSRGIAPSLAFDSTPGVCQSSAWKHHVLWLLVFAALAMQLSLFWV